MYRCHRTYVVWPWVGPAYREGGLRRRGTYLNSALLWRQAAPAGNRRYLIQVVGADWVVLPAAEMSGRGAVESHVICPMTNASIFSKIFDGFCCRKEGFRTKYRRTKFIHFLSRCWQLCPAGTVRTERTTRAGPGMPTLHPFSWPAMYIVGTSVSVSTVGSVGL